MNNCKSIVCVVGFAMARGRRDCGRRAKTDFHVQQSQRARSNADWTQRDQQCRSDGG